MDSRFGFSVFFSLWSFGFKSVFVARLLLLPSTPGSFHDLVMFCSVSSHPAWWASFWCTCNMSSEQAISPGLLYIPAHTASAFFCIILII